MGLAAASGLLACPVCRAALTLTPAALRCPAGHAFDIARQGYANLSGATEPANADTAAMLAARARILDAGLFEPLTDVLAELTSGTERLLEAGAGTAHHLRRCLGGEPGARGIAVDVSRAAARIAARTDERIAAVVADTWRGLPILDHCLDVVLVAFAPRNPAEFARVLRPGGRLVLATPEPGHLAAVRERHGLLDIPADKVERVGQGLAEFFEPVATHLVRRRLDLTADQVADVIAMGPNAFHGRPEQVGPAIDRLDVRVQVFRPLA